MAQRRLIWKVAPVYAAVVALCTVGMAWFAGNVVHDFYFDRTARDLEQKINPLAESLTPLLRETVPHSIQQFCRHSSALTGFRVTVIDLTGRVLGDSHQSADRMDNHADRPEVQQALTGENSLTTRFSKTLDMPMMYVAKQVRDGDQAVGVVRIATPVVDIQQPLRRVYNRMALGGLVAAAVTVVLTLAILTRLVIRPLQQLQQGAHRLAAGDLSQRLPLPNDAVEIVSLAESINHMARQLDEKVRLAIEQAGEQQAVLTSMTEGVLAIDAEQRVLTINSAATRLLGIDTDTARGRPMYEMIRNTDLQHFIGRVLEGNTPAEAEITLHVGGAECFLQVHGSVLRNAQGRNIGAAVVLHDITQLRQLELVRQQFVANVSHELKTPIAAIQAAVETLEDEPRIVTEIQTRFLGMISRQAQRLNTIVDDLLTLARVEQKRDHDDAPMKPAPVRPVIYAAVETCQNMADSKGVSLAVNVDANLRAVLNPQLLEQALVNLLDNAIKYSPPDSLVEVTAKGTLSEAVISVRDHGPGIEPQHIPRIFERFYRTDEARSRERGGTGLGLAIVKHIAQAHGGHVDVDTMPNQGSTFHIHLRSVEMNPNM